MTIFRRPPVKPAQAHGQRGGLGTSVDPSNTIIPCQHAELLRIVTDNRMLKAKRPCVRSHHSANSILHKWRVVSKQDWPKTTTNVNKFIVVCVNDMTTKSMLGNNWVDCALVRQRKVRNIPIVAQMDTVRLDVRSRLCMSTHVLLEQRDYA